MRDLIIADEKGRCNWCDHPKSRHVFPEGAPAQCHDCRSGYCTPKKGRTFRINRQLKRRWRKGK